MLFEVAVDNGDGLVKLNSTTTTGNSRAIDHAVTATVTPSNQLGTTRKEVRSLRILSILLSVDIDLSLFLSL
jgi:hypothetical protein